jgi:hypothetical protein
MAYEREAQKMLRTGLAERIREVRQDFCGESGAQFLADDLDIALETWTNYERGVTVPAVVVLKLIDITMADPHWLLTGEGLKYRDRRSRCG